MPSWNIHTAHVERLIDDGSLDDVGISHVDDFLFGNLVPDIYVGYMICNPSRKIAYRETHFADPSIIPAPDASLFYRQFVRGHDVDEVVLGAWTHLLCDHYYNLRTTRFIDRIGVSAGEQTRIRKQADFDLFGRTLPIARIPRLTKRLVRCCEAFPQYPIDEQDVRAAIAVQRGVVRRNQEEHVEGAPGYCLLTEEFFTKTYALVDAVLHEALRRYSAGDDPSDLGSVSGLQVE